MGSSFENTYNYFMKLLIGFFTTNTILIRKGYRRHIESSWGS